MAASDTRTHYDVLGISRDADAAAVRTAWKLHVQAWHPDRFTGPMRDEAERQASRINEAYTVLRDGGRRAAYDCRIAADDADARRDRQPRMSHKVRPAASRAAAAPVGSPMALPEPATLGEQVASMSRDAFSIVRRHPRVFAVAATVWVVVFGGSLIMHAVSGPTLPASAQASALRSAPAVVDTAQAEDLEDLATQAREEAAEADAAMAQLMREDAAIAAADAKAMARERALAARAATKAKRAGTARSGAPAPAAPRRGRIVRVMPTIAR
ncbi:MAG: dnaJ [Thermoleophilia bacterium]|nr:dnaJ [Thermoleophilia bacterium]